MSMDIFTSNQSSSIGSQSIQEVSRSPTPNKSLFDYYDGQKIAKDEGDRIQLDEETITIDEKVVDVNEDVVKEVVHKEEIQDEIVELDVEICTKTNKKEEIKVNGDDIVKTKWRNQASIMKKRKWRIG
ncbi:hypothetical protein Acr_08g0019450 [Actinidia rufa]|uniref:Uncharacterized protein n=1 Tax=Actinidia rufa TaxID=165716 RepID=A0A7J0F5S4_9ERIC|nr:hypothetical protein Acr_08g0019450 [Actinidia rufa]